MMMGKAGHEKKTMPELKRCSVEEYRILDKLPLRVLADNVRSMHNIGSLFRTSDAFRIEELILGGISGAPPHPEISKTALGAEESVKWRHVDDSAAEVTRMKEEGWTVCVLEQARNSEPLHLYAPSAGENKVLLVVGNEVHGVDQEIVDMAHHVLEIPQEGTKHSLNVAASAAIAMHSLYVSMRFKPV